MKGFVVVLDAFEPNMVYNRLNEYMKECIIDGGTKARKGRAAKADRYGA